MGGEFNSKDRKAPLGLFANLPIPSQLYVGMIIMDELSPSRPIVKKEGEDASLTSI